MKKLKRMLCVVLVMTVVFGICPTIDAKAADKVKLSKTEKTIGYSQSFNLSISGTGNKSIKWSTSNKDVAKISKVNATKYKVTGVKPGTATITAKVDGKKYTCKVTVSKLSKTSKNIAKGKSFTLSLKTSNDTIKWSTSDESVAQIKKINSKKYEVTGKKTGTATVTAKVNGKKYTCKVTVTNPKISKSSKSLSAGDSFYLTVSGNEGTVKWSTSDSSVAKITKVSNTKYKVTAKKTGTATIKAKVDGKTLKCEVKVQQYSAPKARLSISSSGNITVKWSSVGAAKYRVFRKTYGGSWKKLGDTTGTSYTDKTANTGTAYIYTVRCINSSGTAYTSDYISSYSGSEIVKYAEKYIGLPYVWGGASLTSGCDCSGFVQQVYAHFGVYLPHYSHTQATCGKKVSDYKAGDIVYYDVSIANGGHVGIYVGDYVIISALDMGVDYSYVYPSFSGFTVRRIF